MYNLRTHFPAADFTVMAGVNIPVITIHSAEEAGDDINVVSPPHQRDCLSVSRSGSSTEWELTSIGSLEDSAVSEMSTSLDIPVPQRQKLRRTLRCQISDAGKTSPLWRENSTNRISVYSDDLEDTQSVVPALATDQSQDLKDLQKSSIDDHERM